MGIHEASAVPDWCGNCGGLARHQSSRFVLRLVVSSEDPGQAIALNFIGLSYESSILASGDYFTPENPSALGLIRSLGENGVIRIGGNTSERTVWGADRRPVGPASFVITPANIDRLAAALRMLDGSSFTD